MNIELGHNAFLYTWLKELVPAVGFARYPIKFIALPVFAIPLLAAYGFQALQDASAEKAGRGARLLIGAGVFFFLVTAGIWFVAHRSPVPGESWPVTCQDSVMRILLLQLASEADGGCRCEAIAPAPPGPNQSEQLTRWVLASQEPNGDASGGRNQRDHGTAIECAVFVH